MQCQTNINWVQTAFKLHHYPANGRTYSHRIPLAKLLCWSEKSRPPGSGLF